MPTNHKFATPGTSEAASAAPVTVRSKEIKNKTVESTKYDAYFDQSGYVVESERNGILHQP